MRPSTRWLVLGALLAGAVPPVAQAQDEPRVALDVEGGLVWQQRNDVQIPNDDTATRFSLVDAIGSGPFGAVRFGLDLNANERHGFRVVIAPLRIDETGLLDGPVSFAGEQFTAGAVDGSYQFSSYRVTYRYRFFQGDRWRWRIGFTGFIRDARIALAQPDRAAEDTDVGFVPLLHLQGVARLSPRWRFRLDVDGLGSTQGRAFDVAAMVDCALSDHWQLGGGYRTIEGGADVDDVYNFAWLHFAVASLRYGF